MCSGLLESIAFIESRCNNIIVNTQQESDRINCVVFEEVVCIDTDKGT